MPHSIKSIFVFTDTKTGEPYKSVKKSFSTALKRAGISNFRFHDLRHTYSSHMIMAGVDLIALKELLGHKDIKMTLRYAHLAPGHKRKAANMLDKVLRNAQKEASLHSFTSQFGLFETESHFNDHKSLCVNDAPVAQTDRATVS